MRKLALMAHLKYKIHKLKGGVTIQTFGQYGTPYSSDGELSSLRAESARAVIGRRWPHSGEGEDFLTHQPGFFFFTKTAVAREQKV